MFNEREFSHVPIVDDFYKYLVELADNKKQVQRYRRPRDRACILY